MKRRGTATGQCLDISTAALADVKTSSSTRCIRRGSTESQMWRYIYTLSIERAPLGATHHWGLHILSLGCNYSISKGKVQVLQERDMRLCGKGQGSLWSKDAQLLIRALGRPRSDQRSAAGGQRQPTPGCSGGKGGVS